MTSQLDAENQHGLTDLVTGMVDDAQEVIKQQFKLFQVEITDKVRHNALGAAIVVVGLGVLSVSGIVFAFAAAYGMISQWPSLPLWGAFAIVGATLLILAAALGLIAKAQFTEFNPSASEKAAGLKENPQWTTRK